MNILKLFFVRKYPFEGEISDLYYSENRRDIYIKAFDTKSWKKLDETSAQLVNIHLVPLSTVDLFNDDLVNALFNNHSIKIKVNSHELSSRIFGFKTAKLHLVGKNIKNFKINRKPETKKDWTGYKVRIYSEDDRWITFCEEDVQLILPNFSKMDAKVLKTAGILVCKNDKPYTKIVKNQKVAFIKTIEKNDFNNKPYIIEVVDRNQNKLKVYAKDFKIL